jgi:hypothetical protein
MDRDLPSTPLYGWTDADLAGVGAPLCTDGPEPKPSSQDPVFPGILVAHLPPQVREGQPENAPALLVSTVSNLRDGSDWTDGCGIVMRVQAWDGACFRGLWDRWGLRSDGSGYFCLCEAPPVSRYPTTEPGGRRGFQAR